MNETKMGYCESKSVCFPISKNTAVKDQRVNGSGCFITKHLRYTLMGFERNYQVQILSKQINKIRLYSSKTALQSLIKLTIDPRFFTGFADGESYFSIKIIGT